MSITSEGNALGATTVEIAGHQACTGVPEFGAPPVLRCFEIAPTTANAATIRFYYRTDELNGNTPASVRIYNAENGAWNEESGTYTRETDGGTTDWVQVTGIDSYSPFTLGQPGPTVIELISFAAEVHGTDVHLEWTTATEIDTAGFNVYRRSSRESPWSRINPGLIPAAGGPTHGADYLWIDHSPGPGQRHEYLLEDIDLEGAATRHHEATTSATLRGNHPEPHERLTE